MSWQQKMYNKQRELNEFIDRLEDQRNDLLDELKSISVGLVITSDPANWGTDTKLQIRAARALEKAAKVRLVRP